MTFEDPSTLAPPMEISPREYTILSLLGQQRALSLDHLAAFFVRSEGPEPASSQEELKSTINALVERLQRAGLLTLQSFNRQPWIWLTKRGLRFLTLPASRKPPSHASLPLLQAANAIRLALEESYPRGTWTSRDQLRQQRAAQKLPPLAHMPTATFDTGEGALLAIHVLLRLQGTEEHLVKQLLEQLEFKPDQSASTAFWYYVHPRVAPSLRRAFQQVSREIEGADARLRLFTYPLVPKVTVYHGHQAPIRHLAWSPDGAWIATLAEDLTFHVWSVHTGALRFSKILPGARGTVLAWSPDGARIAVADVQGALSLWDAATGTLISLTTVQQDALLDLSWASGRPDRLAICAADGDIQVLDLTCMTPVWQHREGDYQRVRILAWSPDGAWLAVGCGDAQVRVLDAITGERFMTYRKHARGISALAWSADSMHIASASSDADIHIWEVTSGNKIRGFWSELGIISSLSWSSARQYLAWAGTNERVEVWNPYTGKKLFVSDDHTAPVTTLAWSPDSMLLASGGDDQTVQVYGVAGRLQ
jgi:hypothetical protein